MSIVKIPDAGGDTITFLEVDGHWHPKTNFENQADAIRGLRNLPVREDDVFICAYPKCGTHWVWEMARLLLSEDTETVINKEKLMLEFFGNDVLEKYPSPRILNTHCLVEQMPRGVFEKKCKIIYILRNPKDMAVSFFHHHKKIPEYEYDGKWENHLSSLMDGKVDFGSFFTYLKDWAAIGTTHPEVPTLTLMYEDLKEDPLAGIKKMAKFLNAEKSEEFYLKVRELTSFNKMKENKGRIMTAVDGSSVMYRKGTHWVWEMARLLLSEDTETVINKEKLMLEFFGNDVLEKYPSPRILNTHCLVEQMPRGVFEKKCKIIYILRNPKDMAVSFFHHHKKIPEYEYDGKWENHLSSLMDGKVDFGSFFTYLKDWAAIGTTHPEVPTLTLMYEDLKEDPLAGIKKMAKFLNAEKSEEFYLKVRELTSFNKMKENKGRIMTAVDGSSVMYRKGEVGDWKNYFTVAQNEAFDRLYKKNMAGCDINFRYTLK